MLFEFQIYNTMHVRTACAVLNKHALHMQLTQRNMTQHAMESLSVEQSMQ